MNICINSDETNIGSQGVECKMWEKKLITKLIVFSVIEKPQFKYTYRKKNDYFTKVTWFKWLAASK